MSEPRLELVAKCDHGRVEAHRYQGPRHWFDCPGGSRRVLDPEQVVTMPYGESVLPFNEDDWEAGGVVRLPVRDIIEALAALEGREP